MYTYIYIYVSYLYYIMIPSCQGASEPAPVKLIPLSHYAPDPYGPPWAFMGWALVGRALWAPWALKRQALMDPSGPLWAGTLWASLGFYGPGPCGPPWALIGRALMGPNPGIGPSDNLFLILSLVQGASERSELCRAEQADASEVSESSRVRAVVYLKLLTTQTN